MHGFARFSAAASALLLVACGDAGGSAAPPGGGAAAVVPATAVPTTTPLSADVLGVVVDDTTHQPIAGALVIVSQSTVIAGTTPPAPGASPWPMSSTGADGSFDVKNVAASSVDVNFDYVGSGYPNYPNAQWVEIFSPDAHAAFHAIRTIAPTGTTNLGLIGIALPSPSDIAWLAQINNDRATVGVPAVATPLQFDSVTLETARYWASTMATDHFYAHDCPASLPSCGAFWLYETLAGSVPSSQNIDLQYGTNSTWQVAEATFMAEAVNCPGGSWQSCPYSENTGHYINIMEAAYWAGVGQAAGPTATYYAENFSSPASFGATQAALRSLGIR